MRAWLKDLLILVAVFGLLLGGTYAYTHVWPPAVIVESSSMMHADDEVRYGRMGTIDPGDLVLVKSVDGPEDVGTLVENSPGHYGKQGDVIIYFSANDRSSTPIIHRAVAWVEPTSDGYRARWDPAAPCVGSAEKDPSDARWCRYGAGGITIPAVNLDHYKTDRAGFLTKGDNPATNTAPDPVLRISRDERGQPSVVAMEWVQGKARGELPWFGLIKLSLAGKPNEKFPPPTWTHILSAYAPTDLWVCLGVSLTVLVGGPIVWDVVKARRAAKPK